MYSEIGLDYTFNPQKTLKIGIIQLPPFDR